MPSLEDDLALMPALAEPEYTILKQRVDLDVDFARQALRGSTEITLQPLVKDLREVNLHCRQCKPTLIQAGGITARWEYEDPYRRARMPEKSTAEQHSMLKRKIQNSLGPTPQPELLITLPSKLKIQELRVDPATALPQYDGTPNLEKQETDAMAAVEAPAVQSVQQQGPQFAPIKIYIEFEVASFRDGIHWVGVADGDARFPYMYTKAELDPGNTSCIFPCMDNATTRCMWEIAIKCPRTLGDAFRKPKDQVSREAKATEAPGVPDAVMTNGPEDLNKIAQQQKQKKDEYLINLTPGDAALELSVLCVGELIDDIADSEDETRHTVLFNLSSAVAARHVGFAIGPFEHVDLAAFREADEEEKLGRSAVKIDAYCLPGRAEELRNTAYPVHLIIDYFGVNYGGFPFSDYQLLFVDDLALQTVPVAGLTFCSAELLFPYEVLDYLTPNTKILIRAVADQWMGVNAIAKDSGDAWIVAGIAGYMTDNFSKKLLGNNEYRWTQKQAADKVYELDVERPSLQQLGALLHLDPSIREFVDLKSALVLAILDRRLIKASSSSGITRIINRVFLDVKTGKLNNGELSTNDFMRTCEKLGHNKLDSFFKQWVYFAGCPIFDVKQRFNKKKLVVEMTITQRQVERLTKPEFEPSNFMREIKEYVGEVWAPEVQPVFTGPMTVRIHEADGTPYEHIIDIKEQVTKLDIPYNTKYKRLKRSRRQKERALATAGGEDGTGGGDDSLLYCLGDILDTPQEVEDWKLKDWTPEEESMMGQESYEWIRMDADFEWIGKIHLQLPLYMYVSQLQQDRDLVAQYESVKYIQSCGTHQTSLSVLVRTLMDTRYFHGIRTIAADAIAVIAKGSLREVGQYQLEKAFSEMFCVENTHMPRPNDWTNRINYILQYSLPQSMAKLRDTDGKVPLSVRRFFIDKLKFNDNSTNEFSDAHYISTLMTCLADSLVVSHREPQASYMFEFGEDEPMADDNNPDTDFEKEAISEIERYRRIDEWISTYHNVYSTTAIECLQKLTRANIVKDKIKELLEYTRVENAINVRLVAFNCLVETGVTRKMSMLAYLLSSLVEDRSPAFRRALLDTLGVALGHIALGDDEPEPLQAPVVNDSGLVLETEVINHELRHLEATRKTSPEGALAALKNILQVQPKFKQALWEAVTSPILALDEIGALADIAALVFDAKVSLGVTLKYPRHWRVINDGRGKVRFLPHGAYRTAPTKGLPFDDWTILQELKLQYNGPLDEEIVKKRETERRVAELQQELEQAQRIQAIEATRAAAAAQQQQQQQQQAAMPPPSSLPTPSVEKPLGLKLNLGSGIKRKQSASSTPREGSPKSQKIVKLQTPNGYSGSSPIPRETPTTAPAPKVRRGSTPASAAPVVKKSGRKIVKLRFNKASSAAKIANLLSKPPRPRPRPSPSTDQHARSSTPSHAKSSHGNGNGHGNSTYNGSSSSSSLISPSSFLASPSQAQALNTGGFRTYAAPAEPAEAKTSSFKRESGSGFNEPKYSSHSSSINKISKSAASSAAPSPTSTSGGGGGGDGMVPPKKKLMLKLGAKKPL
jgi:transcription initiation factor TFIID subunit 2